MVTAGETETLPTVKADKSGQFRAIWFGGCVSFGGEIPCILGWTGWICKGFVKEKGRFVLRKVTIDEQKENRSKGLTVKGLGRLFSAE